jgi:hypothetical protein
MELDSEKDAYSSWDIEYMIERVMYDHIHIHICKKVMKKCVILFTL